MTAGRPFIVWLYTVPGSIVILLEALGSIILLANPITRLFAAITLVLIVPHSILLVSFFMLKRSALKWTYISYGLGTVVSIFQLNILGVILCIIFGWVIADYIKNKKVDGQPLFT